MTPFSLQSAMTSRTYYTYNDYLTHWDKNDKKAAEIIKESTGELVRSFYREIDVDKGELPTTITAVGLHPRGSTKLYPKHSPNIISMCKEVEEFIQSKGFPYKLDDGGSGFSYSSIWPMRCRFELNK